MLGGVDGVDCRWCCSKVPRLSSWNTHCEYRFLIEWERGNLWGDDANFSLWIGVLIRGDMNGVDVVVQASHV